MPVVTTPDTLPDDVATLRALVLTAWAERDAERAENGRLADQNDRLRHLLRQLQRMQFGRRSEKLDPDQFNLALEDLEQAVAETEAEQDKADPALRQARSEKRRAGRGPLPEHLPRVEVVIEPEDTACPCCGGAMHVIGEDRSQRLDVVPAQYQVIVTRRPKYACRTCQAAVLQAPAPARLIEGGLPTERLVAHVVVAKYADHCPLYRQSQILARQGITIDRSVLAFWTGYAAAELKPVWRLMREELLRSTKLFVDETTAPVLDPGRGRTKTGYFWALARDDRPWQGGAPPAVVYSYAPGRRSDYALALLKCYTGVLQTDGYAGYRALADPKRAGGPATLAFCWAHWRRQFFDLAKSPPAPIATEMLKRIAKLYDIEAEIHGKSAEERRAARQQKTKPLVAALKTWLETTLARLAGGSTIAQALRYGLNHWDGLVRFLDDGRIEIDSNTVERSMRPIALNRKNALFAGSDEGAENWAMLASLIETCKLHGVNPEAYLTDVLTKLVNNWSNSRLAELTPWAWAAAH
ncbi:MAG: IS66 family transposase [Solirubrobacterales bacterium]|nr:IS66 family transposase [Solirubrobacterales bacterium]